MLSILGTIIVGFIVGLIARAVKPGDDKLGLIMTTVLGVAGSLAASYVGSAMGWYAPGAPAGWIASVAGAIVLLVIYGLVKKKA
ncbi:GlsB/YeaQ/YmgE family stress response membrane protein [Acidovorax sp. A79]|uniref:GlsB/YeaQ/YmgE family stress response membrane protein n=1 Tax=unclassified Acidovorax TaxID=2684926 RepID=UPI001C464E85|nr:MULTISPECIES: GlsB/YeaQ/YmgE family stress response membrane protein [unclassified Acidovorax]MBV7426762.1 GlsB/YeaQ/YmgE family stress response membrane protein [Acidovorax sp. sif0732]MBV7447887.1 GlsB/YeaQ/YmgE family stress response membrane protein [Acidovorax sp. sif0715]